MRNTDGLVLDSPLVDPRAEQGQTAIHPVFVLAGLIWGLGAVAATYSDEPSRRLVFQGVSLSATVVLMALFSVRVFMCWMENLVGLLMTVHVLAAVIAGFIAGVPNLAMLRYALLIPAISMVLLAATSGDAAIRGFRGGLTAAIFLVIGYFFSSVRFSELFNPKYRFSELLNPNGFAFLAAMAGISMFDHACRRLLDASPRRLGTGMIAACGTLACIVLCLATKSRTGTAVFLAGAGLRLLFSIGFTRAFLWSLGIGLLGTLLAAGVIGGLGEAISDVYSLDDPLRGISGGTGRFAAWGKVVTEIWLPNFWFGVGPMQSIMQTQTLTDIAGTHNGLLQALAETGLVGTLPLVIVLAIGFRYSWTERKNPNAWPYICLFVGGFLESMAETMFFSMGNPASVLFILSVAVLGTTKKRRAMLQQPAA